MIVGSLDPGTASGLVIWKGDYRQYMGAEVTAGLIEVFEVDGEESGAWMESSRKLARFIIMYECDVLLIEDFILEGGKGHSSEREGLDPVRITCGVLMLLEEWEWSGQVVYFQPSISSVFHDVRMKKWNIYLQGRAKVGGHDGVLFDVRGFKGHATSAARGLVWWLREKI